MWWDTVITITILLALVLAAWAKLSHQTIIDLFRDIIDFIKERKENAEERYLD